MDRASNFAACLVLLIPLLAWSVPAAWAGEGQNPSAPEKFWTVQGAVDFNSKYVWRGLTLNDEPVLQPWVQAEAYGFCLNIWSVLELTDAIDYGPPNGSGKGKFTEVDVTASYTHRFGPVYLTGGLIHFAFPNTGAPASTEIFASAAYAWLISPSVSVYRDVVRHSGYYASLALTWQQELPSYQKLAWLVEVKAALGLADTEHNNWYFGLDKGGLNDISVTASLTTRWSPDWLGGGWISLKPSVSFSSMRINDIREYMDEPDVWWFGFSVGLGY